MMQGLNYIRRWDYDISDTRLSEKNRPVLCFYVIAAVASKP